MAVKKMVWDNESGRMVDISGKKDTSTAEKIAVTGDLADILKRFALEDGYDLTGISYVTEKTTDGKTKQKDGKPVFVMENGKPKTIAIAESKAKIHSAISDYVDIAVRRLIASRPEIEVKTE